MLSIWSKLVWLITDLAAEEALAMVGCGGSARAQELWRSYLPVKAASTSKGDTDHSHLLIGCLPTGIVRVWRDERSPPRAIWYVAPNHGCCATLKAVPALSPVCFILLVDASNAFVSCLL
ncbi:hypothetical protein GW17_00008311 [Ensete ventricosum]|uniref:Uncharacterized protein n=1 Tax=Ensete ventricosum TaxID=4639 RepID=A0A444FXB3_ENSVE|nr:hypothetical protein GW17_00008311 [Ensete ventricosum]RZR73775.1 hypothetical protein BHM03_00028081 [Ensete ventricosum]